MKGLKHISLAFSLVLITAMASLVPGQTIAAAEVPTQLPNFIMFSGKVKEVRKTTILDAGYKETILAQNAEGMEVAFRITDSTYFVTDNTVKAGDEITGFYDGKAPMAAIYPPQPEARVIVVGLEHDKFIKVDRVDKDLVSEDGQLKLNIGSNTKIILENGEAFDGDLTNRALVVLYSVTTRSIPAQTTPEKIIVLYEKAVPPIYEFSDEDNEMLAKLSQNLIITLNGVAIDGLKPFVNENGVFMLPVRAVAEAMGLHVEWFGDTKTVQVGNSASLSVGKDAYAKNRMVPVKLGTAPVLKDDSTYVPLDFFTEIIGNVTVSYTKDSIEIQY